MLELEGEQVARRQPLTLAAHLLLLTMAVAIPIVALAFFVLNHAIEAQRSSIREGLASHARSLANLVSSRVDDFVIAGRVLAQSKLLAAGDYPAFNLQAGPILPGIAALGVEVFDKESKVLSATSSISAGDFPQRSNPDGPRLLSDVMQGRRIGHIVRVNIPVEQVGAASILSVIVATAEFQKLIERQAYDKEWVIGLLDSSMNFVARTPEGTRVGTPASKEWQAAVRSSPQGLQEIMTLENERTITAYTQTAHGWIVGVAVPVRVLDAPVQASRQQFAFTALLSLLASLLIAVLVGKRLTAKAAIIENAARSLSLDREVPIETTGVVEYDKLVASLRESAQLLSLRKTERDTFEQSQLLSGRMLEAALDVVEIAVYQWNPQTDIVDCGPQFRKLWDIPDDATVYSRQLMRKIVGEDRAMIQREILRALAPTGDGLFSAEFRVDLSRERGERWFYCRSRTEFENGRAVCVIGAARDVTERRQREAELESQRQELRTMANAMPQLVWVADPSGNLVYFNENRAFYRNDERGLMDWAAMIHPDDLAGTTSEWQRAVETGQPYSYEHRLILADGAYAWHLSRALPTRNERGEIVRWHGTATNIHEHKLREEHIRVLLAEVNHRSKNLLAVVQAIVRQTAKSATSTDEFAEKFNARVKALATSQELITAQNWRGVRMSDLARSQLDHYSELIDNRMYIDGPDLLLGPEVAQALGMALHELSTNASKHGSLSNASGKVDVNWSVESREGIQMFVISWVESGGPPVRLPERTGFGSFVIDRMLSGRLGAEIKSSYEPQGFVWTLSAPLENMVADNLAPDVRENKSLH